MALRQQISARDATADWRAGAQKHRDLAFVLVSHPDDLHDRSLQAGIRRHVMRGVGQARRKKPRAVVVPLEMKPPDQSGRDSWQQQQPGGGDDDGDHHDHRSRGWSPAAATVARSLSPSGLVGLDLDPRSLELVAYMRFESDTRFRACRIIWLTMGLSDPSAFQLSLAAAAVFLGVARGETPVDYVLHAEGARYYNATLQQLSRRLADPSEQVSAGVIATVLGFLCLDTDSGHWDRWAVHIGGLVRISRLRGGFDGLENHIPLLALWLDLVGGTVVDAPPRMSAPKDLCAATPVPGDVSPRLRMLLHQLTSEDRRLLPVVQGLELMSALAGVVNRRGGDLHFWRDDVGALHLLTPVIHHFLSAPRHPDHAMLASDALYVGEMTRLVCLMLISALKERFALNTSDALPLQTRFSSLVMRGVTQSDGCVLELRTWALVTATLLQPAGDRAALMPYVLGAVQRMSMQGQTPHGVVDSARGLLWVDALDTHEPLELEQGLLAAASYLA